MFPADPAPAAPSSAVSALQLVQSLEPRLLLSAPDPTPLAGLYHASAVLSAGRYISTVVTAGDDLIYAGGWIPASADTSAATDVYNTRTGQWSASKLSESRAQISTYLAGTKVLFVGGSHDAYHSFGSRAVDIFDTATGQWTTPPVQLPYHVSAGVVGNQVIFAGGTVDEDGTVPSAATWIYDAAANTWTTSSPLAVARGRGVAVAVVGHTILFAGGITPDGSGALDAVDVYDASTSQWLHYHLSAARGNATVQVVGTHAIFAGGVTQQLSNAHPLSDAIDVYDAATGQWSATRLSHLNPDGYYSQPPTSLVVGHRAVFESDQFIDIYDADTDQWGSTVIPAQGSSFQRAPTAALGTTVFFTAGTYGVSQRVDFYDLSTGKWGFHFLQDPHSFLGVIDGKFVAAGGFMQDGGPIDNDTLETYTPGDGTWSITTLPQTTDFSGGIVIGTRLFLGGATGPLAYDVATGSATVVGPPTQYGGTPVTINGQLVYVIDAYPTSPVPVTVFLSSPIGEPSDPSIAPGAGIATSPSELTWAASPGAAAYDVYLDDSLVSTVSTNHWSPGVPIAAGIHAWQVVASTGNMVTPGPRWTFSVGVPAKPAHPNIATGTLKGLPALCTWRPSIGAQSYDFYLDGKLLGSTTNSSFGPIRHAAGGTHTWRVVARNALADTPGPVWSFRIPAPILRGSVAKVPRKVTSAAKPTVTLTNSGAALPGPFSIALYASQTRKLGNDAILVGRVSVADALASGASLTISIPLESADNLPAGAYHLIAAVITPAGKPIVFASAKFTVFAHLPRGTRAFPHGYGMGGT